MHVELDGQRFRNPMLFEDQFTVERARADQKARITSDTAVKAPDGLEPPTTDGMQRLISCRLACMYMQL